MLIGKHAKAIKL